MRRISVLAIRSRQNPLGDYGVERFGMHWCFRDRQAEGHFKVGQKGDYLRSSKDEASHFCFRVNEKNTRKHYFHWFLYHQLCGAGGEIMDQNLFLEAVMTTIHAIRLRSNWLMVPRPTGGKAGRRRKT